MSNYCYSCRIDVTKSVNLAKFVNDSPEQYSNCFMRKIAVEKIPRLILVAKKLIKSGTELRYNYGDTKNLHWRSKVCFSLYLLNRFY